MDILTQRTPVTGEITIWAIPNLDDDAEQPFRYELKGPGERAWASGAVKVNSQTVTLHVPEGLNLVAKAIDTLKEAQDEVRKDAAEKVASLEQRIGELALLTHQAAPDANGNGEGVTLLHPED